MKQLTEKILIMALFAGVLFLLFGISMTKTAATGDASIDVRDSVYTSAPVFEKRVIYQCRLGNEEIPAVRISEVSAPNGQAMQTIAHVDSDSEFEITARGAARWDYKSIVARSSDSRIEVAFKPNGATKGFDWILTLADKNTDFKKRVRDCMEVSDE